MSWNKIDLCGGCDSGRELLPVCLIYVLLLDRELLPMCFAEPTPNVLPRELLPIFVLPRATP